MAEIEKNHSGTRTNFSDSDESWQVQIWLKIRHERIFFWRPFLPDTMIGPDS
jgi:hypothetical protein